MFSLVVCSFLSSLFTSASTRPKAWLSKTSTQCTELASSPGSLLNTSRRFGPCASGNYKKVFLPKVFLLQFLLLKVLLPKLNLVISPIFAWSLRRIDDSKKSIFFWKSLAPYNYTEDLNNKHILLSLFSFLIFHIITSQKKERIYTPLQFSVDSFSVLDIGD